MTSKEFEQLVKEWGRFELSVPELDLGVIEPLSFEDYEVPLDGGGCKTIGYPP